MADEDETDAPTPEKAPDAFRTISEVAQELDLPQHVLRFWETRFPQIKPLKRGGGRRYYRPNDVELLRGIRHLLYGEGYTIRGVQRILREQGLRFVAAVARGEAEIGFAEDDERSPPSVRAQREPAEAPDWEPDESDEGDGEEAEMAAEPVVRADTPQRRAKPVRQPVARAEPEADDEEDEIEAELPAPAPPSPIIAAPPVLPARLAAEDVRVLEGMLLELLECKRLLDQAR